MTRPDPPPDEHPGHRRDRRPGRRRGRWRLREALLSLDPHPAQVPEPLPARAERHLQELVSSAGEEPPTAPTLPPSRWRSRGTVVAAGLGLAAVVLAGPALTRFQSSPPAQDPGQGPVVAELPVPEQARDADRWARDVLCRGQSVSRGSFLYAGDDAGAATVDAALATIERERLPVIYSGRDRATVTRIVAKQVERSRAAARVRYFSAEGQWVAEFGITRQAGGWLVSGEGTCSVARPDRMDSPPPTGGARP